MKHAIFAYALLATATTLLAAQQTGQTNPYEGTSNPPADSTITTDSQPAPSHKPAPGRLASAVPAQPQAAKASAAQPAADSDDMVVTDSEPLPAKGVDDGIVQVESEKPADQPALSQRAAESDPDSDIVHPQPLRSGQLGEGAVIRVRLLERLNTVDNQGGDRFRTRVASDVMQNGQVLIPTGSEIDGTVVRVSSGRVGGRGSMHLRPETVILPNGSRFRLYAQVTGTPGSNTQVGNEGDISAGSRLKKDGFEYGGAVGAGAAAGAMIAGPGGALAGTLIGAGVITAHLLISHPQANLEPGTVLTFALTEPLNLVPAPGEGN